MVGVTGLEPMASWSRTKRDTKLRHTPIIATQIIIQYANKKINRFVKLFICRLENVKIKCIFFIEIT